MGGLGVLLHSGWGLKWGQPLQTESPWGVAVLTAVAGVRTLWSCSQLGGSRITVVMGNSVISNRKVEILETLLDL